MGNESSNGIRTLIRSCLVAVTLFAASAGALMAQNTNGVSQNAPGSIQTGSISVQPQTTAALVGMAKISMSDAIDAATKAYPSSRVIAAKISVVNGSLVYEIQLAGRSSAIADTTAVIDAGNARILGTFADVGLGLAREQSGDIDGNNSGDNEVPDVDSDSGGGMEDD